MSPWYFLVAALAVLAALLLFGFVGCVGDDPTLVSTENQPDGNPDPTATAEKKGTLVGFWQLQEPAGTPIGGTAADAKGLHDGTYKTQQVTEDDTLHSPGSASPPTLNLGVPPGLLDYIPNTSMEVNGGYVEVPFSPTLNSAAFSVVALAQPEWDRTKLGYYYCLLESSAPVPAVGQGKRLGFAIYAGPTTPDPGQPYQWQVWLGDGASFQRVPATKPSASTVEFNRTLLAVTYDGTKLKFYVYYPGSDADPTSKSSDLDNVTVIDTKVAFMPNLNDESLFIGMGRSLFPLGAGPPQDLLYPFNGKIQNVAVYQNALQDSDVASLVLADFKITS
ncbi:MAG TPA: hypothetical protein VKM93_17650 [Terriglobia bacterium]|nr:hypothetical protein [Terriglobia bacterium]